ncbi:hypothetical protein ACE4Z5_25715, partial [Salmonella enterica]|uniref:hypothetical protein n=1 Tax=Salmonella enterica TaxID=28901 RepID=UPI003D2B48F4
EASKTKLCCDAAQVKRDGHYSPSFFALEACVDRDDRGVALSVGSAQTLEAINRFQRSFLAGGTDFAAILESAEQDKHCAVAQCLSAVLMM